MRMRGWSSVVFSSDPPLAVGALVAAVAGLWSDAAALQPAAAADRRAVAAGGAAGRARDRRDPASLQPIARPPLGALAAARCRPRSPAHHAGGHLYRAAGAARPHAGTRAGALGDSVRRGTLCGGRPARASDLGRDLREIGR